MTVDIQSFCSTEKWRPRLHKPFSRGGYTWATNGHILIRVQLIKDVPDNGGSENVEGVWNTHFKPESFKPAPPLSILPNIPTIKATCEACDGSGVEHECSHCSHECEECDGTGQAESQSERKSSVTISGIPYSVHYVRQILSLPDCEIEATPVQDRALAFRFRGGEGILMALREPYDHHTEIAA
jgi:hypothetical protein